MWKRPRNEGVSCLVPDTARVLVLGIRRRSCSKEAVSYNGFSAPAGKASCGGGKGLARGGSFFVASAPMFYQEVA